MKVAITFCLALFILSSLAYGQESVYYLLVEKDKSDKWQFKNLSLEYPKYENKNQEILAVDRYKGYNIYPSYEETPEWRYLGNYSRDLFAFATAELQQKLHYKMTYECKVGSSSTKYTPCNSNITGFVDTAFFGIFGNTRYSHQSEKFKEIIETSNLKTEIKSCREKYYGHATEFLKNIDVKVIDQSGYYDNSKLYDIVPINDCILPTTNDIKYIIDTSPTKNFSIDIDQWEYKICTDTEKCKISPTITILSRYINSLVINDEFTDGVLSFRIDKVVYDKVITLTYSIINNSKSYVSIDNISLYLDSEIRTDIFNRKIEILPKSKVENRQFIINSDIIINRIIKKAERINVDAGIRYFSKGGITYDRFIFALNKKTENTNMTVGIASKYTIDGVQKTLFDSKEYSLKRLSGLN